MTTKVIIKFTHEICPENEYLSDEELIDYTLAGIVTDGETFVSSPMVTIEKEVTHD